MPKVFVLNQYAHTLTSSGGTRHAELFSQLSHWEYLIFASPVTQSVMEDPKFVPVPVRPHTGNGFDRVIGWIQFASKSTAALVSGRYGRPDIVYASSPQLLTALAGEIVARRWRVPMIFEVRDPWPEVFVAMGRLSEGNAIFRVMRLLERRAYRFSSRVVVLSRGVQDSLKRRGVASEKLAYIPNAASVEFFQVEESREELRRKFGFHRFTFVYAGAQGPANGLELLLAAARQVPQVDVVIVGRGICHDELVEVAAREGIENVRFMESMPKREIPQLLKAADSGVHCLADVPLFQRAVSPNKLFDYMASGIPVLTNVSGEVGGLVDSVGCGIPVKAGGLAQGMADMAAFSPSERDAMGHRGQEYIRLHQSREDMANRLEELLDTVHRQEKERRGHV